MKTLPELDGLNEHQLRRLLVEHLTKQKLGLYWESNAIERDAAINANLVFPRLVPANSHGLETAQTHGNLIIEGDNFDSLRLLRSTHRGKIRVIYIDPPYNTGNKDWVYNDSFVGANDRYRHSQWLEFIYRRLMLARDLLSNDGVIMVSINDENRARLELLMDEVFPGRRLGSLVWRTKDTGNDLSQRFSHVHEHILVYANPGFKFSGSPTDRGKFRNPDNDVRGDWSPQPLTKAHTFLERENTYYPIQNPKTGYWYPCDPNRVWAYASETEIRNRLNGDEVAIRAALDGLRKDTIEKLIEKDLIYFPPCDPKAVMLFRTKAELLAAIKAGKGPVLPKKKTPLLREDLPDIDFWVGRPIATGRPSRKEHWTAKPEDQRIAPLCSWVAGINEEIAEDDEDALEEPLTIRSTRGGVATEEIKTILGSKAFSYPKPLSLIKGLLSQATGKNDIVLDFFAGSGTTAHAVLELNAEDGGDRSFILCSSAEATSKEPTKNLCRDVCAERIRRVMAGHAGKPGMGGSFAYLQLDLIEPADVPFDATTDHALQLLSLRHQQAALAGPAGKLSLIANDGQVAVVLATSVDDESIAQLLSLPTRRLVVYSDRPQTISQCFADAGREISSYSLEDALMRGQATQQGAFV